MHQCTCTMQQFWLVSGQMLSMFFHLIIIIALQAVVSLCMLIMCMNLFNVFSTVTPNITQHPKSLIVVQPANAPFTCAANAVPLPTIQWMRNGATLSSGPDYNITTTTNSATNISSTLTVLSSTPLDAGEYYCIAANSVGTVNASATVTVNVVPTISVAMSAYTVNENSTVTFQCTGTGVPEPAITWYRNGALITDDRFTQSITSSLNSSTLIYNVTGSLILTNAYDTDTDTGYSCGAGNIAQFATDSFGLTVNCK